MLDLKIAPINGKFVVLIVTCEVLFQIEGSELKQTLKDYSEDINKQSSCYIEIPNSKKYLKHENKQISKVAQLIRQTTTLTLKKSETLSG